MIKKIFSLRNIIVTIYEIILIVVAVFTFEGINGKKLPSWVFVIMLLAYAVYLIYRLILKVFDDVNDLSKGK